MPESLIVDHCGSKKQPPVATLF